MKDWKCTPGGATPTSLWAMEMRTPGTTLSYWRPSVLERTAASLRYNVQCCQGYHPWPFQPQTYGMLLNSPKLPQWFPYKQVVRILLFILYCLLYSMTSCFILITKQVIFCGEEYKEKIHADKLAGVKRVYPTPKSRTFNDLQDIFW